MTMNITKTSINDDDLYDGNNSIKVNWKDTIDNWSKSKERQIEKYFQTKYNTKKVKVIYKPILNKKTSLDIDERADVSELVLDSTYQKKLIEKYIEDNDIKISMDYLMRLDNTVTNELEDYKEQTNRYKKYIIKEIEFSNFLAYGEDNKISIDGQPGITSIISDPKNEVGKTSLSIDILLFMFFGTTSKTDKLEEIFNRYTDSKTVEVKGTIEIDGEEFVINRRIFKKESKDGFKYNAELDFYQKLSRGGIKQLNGDERKNTEKLIKEYVGSEDDFLITILTTGEDLNSLIKTKPTERGRILTKFIGLEFFRKKEAIAKEQYSTWLKKSKLSSNNVEDVKRKIEELNENINQNEILKSSQLTRKEEIVGIIKSLENNKDDLLKRRVSDVDTELYKTKREDIDAGIKKVTELINQKKTELTKLKSLSLKPDKEFDIEKYSVITSKIKSLNESFITNNVRIETYNKDIKNLEESEICELCLRPLEGVDNSGFIIEKKGLVSKLEMENIQTDNEIKLKEKEKLSYDNIKTLWDNYNKNELLVQKNEMELNGFNESLKRGMEKLKLYSDNLDNIIKNQKIDTDISLIRTQLTQETENKETALLQIKTIERDIEGAKNKITDYETLIKELQKEEIIDKIYRVYLDIYGKNGISKLVLSSMMPLINSHIKSLLADTCSFTVEMRMNDKNEVDFWMIDDDDEGVEKPLKSGSGYQKTVSSLALRCVLSKVCSMPKPNIIVFDEITGGVAQENMDKIGSFFEKIREYFDQIWLISHDPIVQNWGDKTIKIVRENKIAKILS